MAHAKKGKTKLQMETYFNEYRDVHRSIILKTEALRTGIKFSNRAKAAAKSLDTVFKGHHLFSFDVDSPVIWEESIPTDFFLKRDNTLIQTRINSNSPYQIDFSAEEKFTFCEGDYELEEIYFRPAPEYYSKKTEDGTPMRAIVQSTGHDMLFITINKYCGMWSTNDQCLFCDFVTQTKTQKKMEETVVHKSSKQISQTLKEAFKDWGMRHLMITGGSILDTYQGKIEIEYYCEHLRSINDALGGFWYPANFQINARSKEDMKKIHETGVGGIQPNLEVWDKKLFKILCPGKDKFIGYDEWIKRMIDAVDIFGVGRVSPNFVTGVEMAKPWGFEDVNTAVKSTLEGFDFLMGHGVLPRSDMWVVEPNSGLKEQEPPPLKYYMELGKGYLELRNKHKMPTPFGHCRGCYRIDTTYDFEYFHGA